MLTAGWVRLSARAAREKELWRAIAWSVRKCVTCKSIGKIYVMVRIKTIDFPDGDRCGTLGRMDNNLYALETLVALRLTEARATAHRLDLLALARPPRTSLRRRIGATLIALGEWLRDAGAVVSVRTAVR
ncbi:MAG TPA: hypothetical protein VNF03_03530 [Patescibacteria group bacterium]|jgi:hypothetical protein|nr:hypothetical protein [Patescibacteria group bacterium]